MNKEMEKAVEKILKTIKGYDFEETPKITCQYLTTDKKDLSIALYFSEAWDDDIVTRDFLIDELQCFSNSQKVSFDDTYWETIISFSFEYSDIDEIYVHLFWKHEN